MVKNLGDSNSIAQSILAEIRDIRIQSDRARFRFNLERLGELMAFEISKTLTYRTDRVDTPLGSSEYSKLEQQPVLIAVMRAALPYWSGFQKIFDQADTGFIGAYRREGNEISIQVDYTALPDVTGKDVILIDPMLATGKSMVDTVQLLKKKGNFRSIKLAALIASPQGIQLIQNELGKEISIWTYAIDRDLNAQSYIVPGLGDAGDLCFGEKL